MCPTWSNSHTQCTKSMCLKMATTKLHLNLGFVRAAIFGSCKTDSTAIYTALGDDPSDSYLISFVFKVCSLALSPHPTSPRLEFQAN